MRDLAHSRSELAADIAARPSFIRKNYLTHKGLSWAYLRYRVMRPLLKMYKKWLLRGFNDNIPWLTPAAIQILDQLLTPEMRGLEYGSGRSTVFFAMRLSELDSVEHHAEWHDLVVQLLAQSGVSNVNYFLIEGEKSEHHKEIEKRNNKPFDHENQTYRKYIDHINSYPDDTFDFILIDGRARPECARLAVDKLKSGGIFILDNSERKRYETVHKELQEWLRVDTTTGLTDTTFWFKP